MSLGFLFLQVLLQSQSGVHVKISFIDCSEFIHLMSGLWSPYRDIEHFGCMFLQVGVLIEEPFPILALDRMCAKAYENIQELVKLQVQAQDHLIAKAKRKRATGVTIGAGRL